MNRPARTIPLLALLALAACSGEPEQAPEIIRPVLSTVIQPRTKQVQGFAGTIQPQVSADLAFRILGRVVSRPVNVGDLVKKGQTVAALDPVALELSLQAARADLSSAEAQFANASGSEERQRALLASGNTPQAAYDAAKQGRDSARANLERSRAALVKAEEELGYARLFSDFDGIVTATGAEVGQTVSPGQMVVTVARSDIREAVFDVPEDVAASLNVGAPFEVVLQSQPSIRAQGKIREIAPQAESATRTRRVRLTLTNPPPAFRLGATMTARRVADVPPSIVLPLTALLERDGQTSVWVVDPRASTVSLHEVKVGARSDGTFTVAGGLEPGTRVVTAGVNSLTDGQKVKIPEGGSQ
ncbi:RND family efflux transporter MFP subunit [Mesorhizobium soli]|jgi:RND family efflux transporter MFP subunit|uniref:efflux RND transporter periplasmic adaptor subunit n=1 Tax=Pseudaminobacter soli (ex Li et al. 2025) TaxID=1295366 RepID=UPI002473426C|nr:efflux RND transporter periplasmic adaptor subunit [Mesorhizobium soli]MDH6231092.1 RND family efflux transporter MFP subunit [Mesorhizobium soli]